MVMLPAIEGTARERPSLFAVHVLGRQPHPTQAEFMDCRARVKVACCGRRWGKSMAAAMDAVWFAVVHGGTRQLIVAPTADQGRLDFSTVRDLVQGAPTLRPLITHLVESPYPALRIKGLGGESAILVRSAAAGDDAANLRGHGFDRLIREESAYIADAAHRRVLAPLLATSRYAEDIHLSTPAGSVGVFFEAFTRGEAGEPGFVSFRFPSSSSPFVSAEYLQQQRESMSQLAYDVEFGAQFLDDERAVFPAALIAAATAVSIVPGPQEDHSYAIGWDPARFRDRSGLAVIDTTDPGRYALVEVVDVGGKSYLEQCRQVAALSRRYFGAHVLLDSTAHDQALSQLVSDGVDAQGFTFTPTGKRELIDALVLGLESGELRILPHPELQKELTFFRFDVSAGGVVKLGAAPGHHDDLVCATALALKAARDGARHRIIWEGMEEDLAATNGKGRILL